jgi:plasmid maintenance system antidote protein VapI
VHVGDYALVIRLTVVTVLVMKTTVGLLLRRQLLDEQLTQAEAAQRLGCSAKHLNQILQNKASLSIDLALGFERICSSDGLAERALILQVRCDLEARRAELAS